MEEASQKAERLVWPPTKADLERLYLRERLSAMKIAKRYELKYPSEKTAESTILYHLKRNGIARRDCAEHVRKVTAAMVDEWVARYQGGESLKQIAGDLVDPVTVFVHLHRRGLQLRDKVEATIKALTKHPRRPFEGDELNKAYLIGLVKGDFYATTHGRAVRVKTATTHPKMTELARALFASQGAFHEYPRVAQMTGFEWSIDCDLDASYAFLLRMDEFIPKLLADDNLFWAFLAGFFDAEGNIYYHRKGRSGAFELAIVNLDDRLLNQIAARLRDFGLHPVVDRSEQSEKRLVKGGAGFIWRLRLWRHREVHRSLNKLRLRHPEKVEEARIALKLPPRPSRARRDEVTQEWEATRAAIKKGVADYVERARQSHEARQNRRLGGNESSISPA